MKNRLSKLLTASVLLLTAALLSSCAEKITEEDVNKLYTKTVSVGEIDIENELVPLDAEPAVSSVLVPEASGTDTAEKNGATIDYSNTAEGYVMIKYVKASSVKLKVQIKQPSGTVYTYNLTADGEYEVFPLSGDSGTYKITVYKNTTGTKYTSLLSKTVTVTLEDEFLPFLYPNQYVNFSEDTKAVALAAELTEGCKTSLEKIAAVFDYVVNNLTYDTEKAKTVKSGYLPDIDAVLEAKKGICFDYSSLLTAMLRSIDIPTKLVVGYSGETYHAWINTYTDEYGWVDSVIYFDGKDWKLLDPTYVSNAYSNSSKTKAILKYVEDSSNYKALYLY